MLSRSALDVREVDRHDLLELLQHRVRDRTERDDDLAVFGLYVGAALAGDDLHDLVVGAAIDLGPELLELVGIEDVDRDLVHQVRAGRRDRTSEELGAVGERILGSVFEIDGVGHRCRHAIRDRGLDRWIMGERLHGVDVPVRVQQLVATPQAEAGDGQQDRADDRQHLRPTRSSPARLLAGRLDRLTASIAPRSRSCLPTTGRRWPARRQRRPATSRRSLA